MRRLVVMIVFGTFFTIGGQALAGGGCGDVGISPNPGWRGANIVISGNNFTPGSQIFVNFGGVAIGTTTSNVDGAFSLQYTIPGDYPIGVTNVFAQDAPANCEDNPSYTVNASPPTTTTTAPATTTTVTATTTTLGVSCGELTVSPDPGWRGAVIVISGDNFTPGSQIFVNFGGVAIGTALSDVDGAFSLQYTIPADYPVGFTNVFAQDAPANCEDNPSYTVNASPPTTTTTAPATTTTTVTATTTTLAESSGEGGGASFILLVLGALLGAGLLGGGLWLGRRIDRN